MPYIYTHIIYFLRSRPNQEVLYTIRMKELGVQKYVRAVPCLCSKYHFSEGELSGTSYSTKSIFYIPLLLRPLSPSVILFYLFSRWFSKRNTWAFLSAKWRGLHVFLVLKTNRHLKIWQTFWGKNKIKGL